MQKTLENLTKAFIGESQARNRYTFYAKQAKKDGYPELEKIFLETADNEREHAKWLFRMIQNLKKDASLDDDAIVVEAEAPLTLGDTVENLKAAIAGEHYENSEMYPEFAKVAKEEGLDDVAQRLNSIGRAEIHHEERYIQVLKEIEAGTFFKKDEEVTWTCIKCGYSVTAKQPPEKCPSCDHPTEYFMIRCEKY
ncbi:MULTISPECIES: rubrerythrin [Methanobacterium]|mgnify:CR=1 FL=1|jgi:rubrerythrin|uniref:Rubrerythrin n=1 Tax=Methanobacterium formicicum TaxID=2162 RepID=A0A089ZCQ3_METFO|nr:MULTISPECIES: rubrerythrin family protein [Methanobacterium]AIS31822.1 rubrerythrin [Methanobacterium formicicum]MBF4475276.1 rubrerythrin family protein [Methanobacterium formicicum]MDG3547110.1 rubrerythrin family protein [Methanobacterium formicicum]MDH2659244.1 rubrerythrin family protein [Methanobacterium formicicum]CEA13990.1 putative rubrerythrin [Methanobacterium formicicum]